MSAKRVPSAVVIVLAVASATGSPARAEDPLDTIRRVSAEAVTIPKQAEALARLAWPEEGRSEPELAAAARERLVRFGHNGLPALRASLRRADRLLTGDVTSAFIEARWRVSAGEPQDFLPGLVDALWYGSAEARRLAMLELSRFQFSPAVTQIIDAVHDHPQLTRVAIASLGRMSDPRGRFFLNGLLIQGDPRYRDEAARALVFMGDEGLNMLREATSSEHLPVRRAALAALLPFARHEDLTILYEFVADYPDSDPDLLSDIQQRATELEAEWEQEMAATGDDSGS